VVQAEVAKAEAAGHQSQVGRASTRSASVSGSAWNRTYCPDAAVISTIWIDPADWRDEQAVRSG
jgi:hypothetical protein